MYQPRPPTSKRPSANGRTPFPPMRDTKSSQARKRKVVKTKDEKRQRNNGKNYIFLRIIYSYLYIVEAWYKWVISIPFPTYVCTHHLIITLYTIRNSVLSAGVRISCLYPVPLTHFALAIFYKTNVCTACRNLYSLHELIHFKATLWLTHIWFFKTLLFNSCHFCFTRQPRVETQNPH